jgi:alcohol dehydrogenase class IV
LPHVVRWNGATSGERYEELAQVAKISYQENPVEALALRLETLIAAGRLPAGLASVGIKRDDLETLAKDAATQWTGTFNPRPFGAAEALEVYQCAF